MEGGFHAPAFLWKVLKFDLVGERSEESWIYGLSLPFHLSSAGALS